MTVPAGTKQHVLTAAVGTVVRQPRPKFVHRANPVAAVTRYLPVKATAPDGMNQPVPMGAAEMDVTLPPQHHPYSNMAMNAKTINVSESLAGLNR